MNVGLALSRAWHHERLSQLNFRLGLLTSKAACYVLRLKALRPLPREDQTEFPHIIQACLRGAYCSFLFFFFLSYFRRRCLCLLCVLVFILLSFPRLFFLFFSFNLCPPPFLYFFCFPLCLHSLMSASCLFLRRQSLLSSSSFPFLDVFVSVLFIPCPNCSLKKSFYC